MGQLDESRYLERLQFFDGQRLSANDLQNVETFNREMRELHNRSLHQAGVGSGFAAYGAVGDREAKIGAGYAIDSDGKEIVLTREETLQIPPVESEDDGRSVFYYLTVSAPSDDDLEEAETRQGICLPRGTVRLREEPVFCWVRLTRDNGDDNRLRPRDSTTGEAAVALQLREGKKIILARAEILDCKLVKALSLAQRRNARPSTQPYVFCGKVENPKWTSLALPAEIAGASAPSWKALQVKVDTAGAGFRSTPCYFARVVYDDLLQADPNLVAILPSVTILDPSPDSFVVTANLMVYATASALASFVVDEVGLEWTGVE